MLSTFVLQAESVFGMNAREFKENELMNDAVISTIQYEVCRSIGPSAATP